MRTLKLSVVVSGARVLACFLAITHLLGALWFSDPARTAVQDLYSALPAAALLIAALVPNGLLKRLATIRVVAVVLLAVTLVQYAEAFITSIGSQPHPFAATVRGLVLLVTIVLIARVLLSAATDHGRGTSGLV